MQSWSTSKSNTDLLKNPQSSHQYHLQVSLKTQLRPETIVRTNTFPLADAIEHRRARVVPDDHSDTWSVMRNENCPIRKVDSKKEKSRVVPRRDDD